MMIEEGNSTDEAKAEPKPEEKKKKQKKAKKDVSKDLENHPKFDKFKKGE